MRSEGATPHNFSRYPYPLYDRLNSLYACIGMISKPLLFSTSFWSVVLIASSALGDPTATPPGAPPPAAIFPSSPTIEAQPLPEQRRNLLLSMLTLPENDQGIERARKQLCSEIVTPPSAEAALSRVALAVTEADMSVEVAFEEKESTNSSASRFSIFAEFREYDILLRSSKARFASEVGGVLLLPEKVAGRTAWMEGKGDTSILVYVPALSECGLRAVALCPRSYVPRSGLQGNGYTLAGARYFYSTKADGLFAADTQNPGRIRASVMGSSGLTLPEKWFDEQLSGINPSATFKHIVSRPTVAPGSFLSLTLPSVASIEARLELGRADRMLRKISERTSIEISEFQLPEKQRVMVHFADTAVEAGGCFLIAKWSETQL